MKNTQSVSTPPIVLCIAGSDTSGLAGIQRDNQTLKAFNTHPINVISANTAQNKQGVQDINHVSAEVFRSQLDSALASPLSAIKIGLLTDPDHINILVTRIRESAKTSVPIIIDPVLTASSGEHFCDNHSLKEFKKLLPLCELITPNINEICRLTGIQIYDRLGVEAAAEKLRDMGARNVLVKGGHWQGQKENDDVMDFFCGAEQQFWMSSGYISSTNDRGTGCTLSSAIAGARAQSYCLADALVIGKMAINQGLRQSYALPEQAGPTNVTHFPEEAVDLPGLWMSGGPVRPTKAFPAPDLPSNKRKSLGLYPVVDSSEWIERLVPLGVSTIQLRVKDKSNQHLKSEIKRAIQICEEHNCRLFINDYWELAIELGAYGVHLGQEDLEYADLIAIHDAGLRLGISTHCHWEVARAHYYRPSYIACGPVYPTTSKNMPWIPHGPEGLSYWRNLIDYPLVAIGGISRERFDDVNACFPDGIAMITGITEAAEPEIITQHFLNRLAKITLIRK